MRVVVLTGGVGGAKLVLGLTQLIPAADITAIVNTGDDFRYLGLHVSPDIDTLLYTLSGKANKAQGWGREGESWAFMETMRSLGGDDWFALGDRDLALHVLRSERMARGQSLSRITHDFALAWGVEVAMLPMSDTPVATFLDTDEGELEFQRYFVQRRCLPKVERICFRGASGAEPTNGVINAIDGADVILFAPSNPYLSVDPILSLPTIRAAIANSKAPRIAVSPLIGGKAVKGPTSKLMVELGVNADNMAIASHYKGLIDGLLIDKGDAATEIGVAVAVTNTLMTTLVDRARVADAALALAHRVGRR